MERKFFICEHCGNVITKLVDSGVPVMCCGQNMTEMKAGTSDGAVEKHVPEVIVNGSEVIVHVGSAAHPMVPEHSIRFIWMDTEKGAQLKELKPGGQPEAHFFIEDGDRLLGVYEYCNLHGLWKADLS